jgi:hypothetical protein
MGEHIIAFALTDPAGDPKDCSTLCMSLAKRGSSSSLIPATASLR